MILSLRPWEEVASLLLFSSPPCQAHWPLFHVLVRKAHVGISQKAHVTSLKITSYTTIGLSTVLRSARSTLHCIMWLSFCKSGSREICSFALIFLSKKYLGFAICAVSLSRYIWGQVGPSLPCSWVLIISDKRTTHYGTMKMKFGGPVECRS